MGVLGALTKVLGGHKRTLRLDGPPAQGAARDAVAALIAAVRASGRLEVREAAEAWLDAVLPREALGACCGTLEAALGPPAKPFGVKVGFDAELAAQIDSRGGIQKNQALYLRRHDDGRVAFAALWPWGDGQRITLKLGVYD